MKISLLQYRFSYLSILLPVLFSLLFLSGCAWQPRKSQISIKNGAFSAATTIPDWVKFPPSDTVTSMYGLGAGNTFDSARQSALKNIAGKLETHVKSETENRAILTNNQLYSSFEQNIQTQVKDTKLVAYETVRSAKVSGTFYLLVSMSRSAFIQDKQQKLAEISSRINQQLTGIANKPKVEQWVIYNRVMALAAQAHPYIYLIKAVDANFNSNKYINLYHYYIQKEQQLSQNTRFFITYSPALKKVASNIRDALQTYNVQTTTSVSKANAIILLDGSVKQNIIFYSKNTVIRFDIIIKTPEGQILSKKHYQLNGSSVTSFNVAYRIALGKLRAQVKDKQALFEMLGLNSQ